MYRYTSCVSAFRHGGVERERKFLVQGRPGDLSKYPRQFLRQGYLAIDEDGTEVRIRQIRERSALRHVITFKAGAGQLRTEQEWKISPQRFTALWKITLGRRIQKTRYRIPHGGRLTIELDIYRGNLRGLVIAEVEFESADQARSFEPPTWFGRELSGNPEYSNQNLARFGLPHARGRGQKRGAGLGI